MWAPQDGQTTEWAIWRVCAGGRGSGCWPAYRMGLPVGYPAAVCESLIHRMGHPTAYVYDLLHGIIIFSGGPPMEFVRVDGGSGWTSDIGWASRRAMCADVRDGGSGCRPAFRMGQSNAYAYVYDIG